MPEYNKTTNYNKKSRGRAKRGKAFKILLWIWQEIKAKINHMAERSEAELSNFFIWFWREIEAKINHMAERSEAELSKFCSELDGRLKPK